MIFEAIDQDLLISILTFMGLAGAFVLTNRHFIKLLTKDISIQEDKVELAHERISGIKSRVESLEKNEAVTQKVLNDLVEDVKENRRLSHEEFKEVKELIRSNGHEK